MKRLVIFLAFFVPVPALAIFSAFAVVKPGTEYEKELNIRVTQTKNSETCTIEFLAYGYDSRHAWLVVSSRPLSKKEQELRGFVWGESPQPRSIELFAKLNPMKDGLINEKGARKLNYIITLKPELASRSYVYIDFPSPVLDGGVYYSIPLRNYCSTNKI